jgi:flagellar biosynthesis protein FlhB
MPGVVVVTVVLIVVVVAAQGPWIVARIYTRAESVFPTWDKWQPEMGNFWRRFFFCFSKNNNGNFG